MKEVSAIDISNWYDRMYALKGREFVRPHEAYPIFLDYMKVNGSGVLLDVGCGCGDLLLSASRRGLKTCGVDVSSVAVRIAKQTSPDSLIFDGSAEHLYFDDNLFDYVTCMGSLEHFHNMENSLKEMKRVAKKDALFCISVPNSNFIYWKVSGKHGTTQQDILERMMSLNEWKRVFIENGFRIIKIRQDKWHSQKLNIFGSLSPVVLLKNLFLKLAWLFLPLRWTYVFIFILRKA